MNISTLQTIPDGSESLRYKMPSAVMRTASTPKNPNDSLVISWEPSDSTLKFYVYFHFTEIENLQANWSNYREFEILYNGYPWHEPSSPPYLSRLTIFSTDFVTGGLHHFSISKTRISTLPPIINAFEIYSLKEFLQAETDQQDGA